MVDPDFRRDHLQREPDPERRSEKLVRIRPTPFEFMHYVEARLPAGIAPAYDGLAIDVGGV